MHFTGNHSVLSFLSFGDLRAFPLAHLNYSSENMVCQWLNTFFILFFKLLPIKLGL